MFNRTAPRALVLAFVLISVVVAAIVLVTGTLGTATAGQDGVPAKATVQVAQHVPYCAEYADGGNVVNAVNGACYLPTTYHGAPTLDTAAYGTDIPRCASDDFNADHVARCYTERVTDGAVLIIDASDTVVAILK